jgi:3-methyladenine DNA glycosylase AlkC
MAEPLKNSFGVDIPTRIAAQVATVLPEFDTSGFTKCALDGYLDLELTPRAHQISDCLADWLPDDRARAIDLITQSLRPINSEPELKGMEPFVFLPFVFFVAKYGLSAYDESMRAQYELTKRFTAEFSIRAFIDKYPEQTMTQLQVWAHDPNVHVRRLVSEGSRPRLPWAPRLRRFQSDPAPVIALLELLKDDSEEYVRRSVANNINDISKDHPELAVEVARNWWIGADDNRRRLIRHGLRTLVKRGDPAALEILGYSASSPARVADTVIEPQQLAIGDKVRISVTVANPSSQNTGALVDLTVHFVKANGGTSPKVFKGAELSLLAGQSAPVSKLISLAQHSTRKHYPGVHKVSIQLNGRSIDVGSFTLLPQ